MIWMNVLKCKHCEENRHTIYIPNGLLPLLEEKVNIRFGMKEVQVDVVRVSLEAMDSSSFFMSQALIDALCIPETQTYQVRQLDSQTLDLGPVIGLLLGEQRYYYHDKYMNEFTDAMHREKEVGGIVIALKPRSIDWENNIVYGLYYNQLDQKWRYSKLPIPRYIFRRAFNHRDSEIKKIKELLGTNLFNSRKFNKWEMYEKLVETKHYKHFLPDTAKLSKAALDLFINQYNKVIVKPIDLSRGRGIFKIERQGSQLLIRDTIDHDFPVKKLIETRELESYLLNKGIDHERYIIQPYLDLAKIDQNPWDIRIIMQKNEEFKWRCNGIECRLAGSNQYITNISRGGRALTIHDALTLAFGANVDAANIKKKLIEISKEFCEILDDNNEHFAEFGLDFAIDCDLNYWFIEANVRPTFNGFKKMDKKNYLHICSAPILYATALSGFNRRKKHVTKS